VLLLRTLETGEFRALGASAPQKVKARIIAATDANLESRICDNTFRAPLLHRLSAYELRLPPLRERREDIAGLLLHFLRSECAAQKRLLPLDEEGVETGRFLTLDLLARLAAYDWPGNVRQLRNVVRQLLLANSSRAALELPKSLLEQLGAHPEPVKEQLMRRKPAEISKAELLEALEKNRWDLKSTAEMLGIARSSLYMLLERSPDIRTARSLTLEELERTHRECNGDIDAMAEKLCISRSAFRRRLRETPLH
jgi:two-component system nitrogen regulation response regulator GlnG